MFGSGFRPTLSIYVRPKLFYELYKIKIKRLLFLMQTIITFLYSTSSFCTRMSEFSRFSMKTTYLSFAAAGKNKINSLPTHDLNWQPTGNKLFFFRPNALRFPGQRSVWWKTCRAYCTPSPTSSGQPEPHTAHSLLLSWQKAFNTIHVGQQALGLWLLPKNHNRSLFV